jgi:hypothetical protein
MKNRACKMGLTVKVVIRRYIKNIALPSDFQAVPNRTRSANNMHPVDKAVRILRDVEEMRYKVPPAGPF